jgi:tetratricopeptide (TPR) repeat protein
MNSPLRRSAFPLLAFAFVSLLRATLPDPEAPAMKAAVDHYHARHDAEARTAFEAIAAQEPTNDLAIYYLARLAKRERDWPKVVAHYERCLELAPKKGEYWANVSEAYARMAERDPVFGGLSNIRKCRKAIERAVAVEPESIPFRMGLLEFYKNAPGIFGGSLRKAREQAAEIAKRDPCAGQMALGTLAVYEKNWQAAEQAFTEAAKLAPDRPEPRFALGDLLASTARYDEARAVYEQMLAENSDNFGALFHIGRMAALSGKELDRGEACLRRYLSQPQRSSVLPTHAEAHLCLGEILRKRGDKTGADAEFAEAQRLDPWSKKAKEALQRVK